jgi:hypothetical protein
MKIKRGFQDIQLIPRKRTYSISRCDAESLTLQRKSTENTLAVITGCMVKIQAA